MERQNKTQVGLNIVTVQDTAKCYRFGQSIPDRKDKRMSRVEEFKNGLKNANKNGGMDHDRWVMYMLSDIALSLARIVDVMEAERRRLLHHNCVVYSGDCGIDLVDTEIEIEILRRTPCT